MAPSYLSFLLILLVGIASLPVAYVATSSSRGAEATNETTTTTNTSYGTTWTGTPPVHVTSSLPLNASDQGLAVGSGKALNRTRGTPISGFWNATHGTGALPTVVPTPSKASISVAGALPGMFSWNGYTGGTNYMTPVENQGSCGSCWAFASIGDMEAQYQINKGNPNTGIDLSEQGVLSCSGGTCSGYYLDSTLNFLRDSGTTDAACNPYVDGSRSSGKTPCGTGRCSDWQSRTWKITGWTWISTDTANIENYLYTHGPVIVWMPVFSDFPWWDASYWQTHYYSHSTSGSYTGHFVVIVGWYDNSYWIVRNSWGTGGGDVNDGYGGYFYMTQDPTTGFFGIYAEAAVISGVSAPSSPVVSTDKSSYAQLESISFTGTGFRSGGSISSCISTGNVAGVGVCVGQPNADSRGNVGGSMLVGTNIPLGPQKFWVTDVSTSRNSNAVQLTITIVQVTMTVSYSVFGGGTGYSSPILSYVQYGASNTKSLTASPIGVSIDSGSSWSVTPNPLAGSSSLERWYSSQSLNGIASTRAIVFTFYHQYAQTLSYAVSDGSGFSPPAFTGNQNGAPVAQTLTATATAYWFDAGSSWSVIPNPLSGSGSSERWYSNQQLSGTVSATTIVFTFYHQYLQTLSYSVNGGGSGYSSPTFTGNRNGASAPQTLASTATSYWYDSGSSWSVMPNPLSGSGTSERWITTQTTSGTISSTQTIAFTYQHQYYLTTQVSPPSGGTVTVSSGWQNSGTTVPVSETPSTGYSFYYWSLDGTNVGNSPSLSVAMNSAHGLTAFFLGSSAISLDVSLGSIDLGGSAILSGAITPTQPAGMTVYLSYSLDGSTWNTFIVTRTDGSGAYSIAWCPPYPNTYQIMASWSGNTNYAGSTSSASSLSVTGTPPSQVLLLVTGSSTVAKGDTASFDVLVTNPGDSLMTTLYIEVIGPSGYEYFDTLQVSVAAGSTGRFQFTWQAPSTSGTYQVMVGLIPPRTASIGQTQITVT